MQRSAQLFKWVLKIRDYDNNSKKGSIATHNRAINIDPYSEKSVKVFKPILWSDWKLLN